MLRYFSWENNIMCKKECNPYDSVCQLNNTHSISYQYVAIPSIRSLDRPMVLTNIRAVTLNTHWQFKVIFEVMHGNGEHCFDLIQGRKQGTFRLIQPVQGPKMFHVWIKMRVYSIRNIFLSKHLASINVDVSQYDF